MVSQIKFRKIDSTYPAAAYVSAVIADKLSAGQSVLWLLPGGSAMAVATQAAELLADSASDLSKLYVSLSDERFGAPGHPDSNWQQLFEQGLKLPGARLQPVLLGDDLEQTIKHYSQTLASNFAKLDYKIALLGIGPDGHIAGIKPGSPAINSGELAAGYEWEDFTRLTMTPEAIERLDEVVCYATGEAKRAALENLDKDLPLGTEPAQILKAVPSATVYNDIKGD